MKLTTERMYEVTEVAEGHIWASSRTGYEILVGAIVKVAAPNKRYTNLLVQKKNKNNNPAVPDPFVELHGITLRPLNQRDQAAIEKELSHGS